MLGRIDEPSIGLPSYDTDTRVVVPATESCTHTIEPRSTVLALPSSTRQVEKATYRPFALIAGSLAGRAPNMPVPPACATVPGVGTEAIAVRPVRRSRTKMSACLLMSPATRFEASLGKAT